MHFIKSSLFITSFIFCVAAIAQKPRSIGRQYSKKLMDQEKYFDKLTKSNGEPYGNKEVNIEMNIDRVVAVEINNNSRTIEIKPWNENKVKIGTTVYFDGKELNVNNDSWLEKLNVKTRLVGNTYKIQIEPTQANSNQPNEKVSDKENVEIYSVDGKVVKTESAKKRPLVIYIPKNNKLKLNSKYADVTITDYIQKIEATITNGNIEIEKVNELELDSKYANVSIGNADKSTVTFINGDFVLMEGNNAELDTKYSNVTLGNINNLKSSSINDEYEIEKVSSIDLNKSYGNCRIDNVTEQIQVEGINAPLKIKQIASSIKSINIDDKYTDIKLPLKEVKSFKFMYDGVYSNIQKGFAINGNTSSKIVTTDNQNDKLNANVGYGTVPVNIKCQNCNLDLR